MLSRTLLVFNSTTKAASLLPNLPDWQNLVELGRSWVLRMGHGQKASEMWQRNISEATGDCRVKSASVRAAGIHPELETISLAWTEASSSKMLATSSFRFQELHSTCFMELFSELQGQCIYQRASCPGFPWIMINQYGDLEDLFEEINQKATE